MVSDVVLLVEDDSDHAALAIRALERSGMANPIAWLQSAEDAIEYLRGCGDDLPVLVLLDLALRPGGIDGLTFMRKIRGKPKWKFLPIVIMSVDPHSIRETYSLGAIAHLVKPVSAEKLFDSIRPLKFGWRLVLENN